MASDPQQYAAVGDDGMRPVVWGLGHSEAEALADARRWLSEANAEHEAEDLRVVQISDERAARVSRGDVDASDL